MSRFSGPAGRGASHTLRAVRRAEAETRQADERARDAEHWEQLHAPEHIKGEQTPRVELEGLPSQQVDALAFAVMAHSGGLVEYYEVRTRGSR